MHKIVEMIIVCLVTVLIFTACSDCEPDNTEYKNVVATETVRVVLPVASYEPIQLVYVDNPVVDETQIPDTDIELIALVTMAEAEGECEEGKRLVIDTILNRVDSGHFPDTVCGVIYQPNQFSAMWNGRIERCEVREEICRLVMEELRSRTNKDVMFFTGGGYSEYGVPLFQVENHYFSSYD